MPLVGLLWVFFFRIASVSATTLSHCLMNGWSHALVFNHSFPFVPLSFSFLGLPFSTFTPPNSSSAIDGWWPSVEHYWCAARPISLSARSQRDHLSPFLSLFRSNFIPYFQGTFVQCDVYWLQVGSSVNFYVRFSFESARVSYESCALVLNPLQGLDRGVT